MILMALDHVRIYFSNAQFSPTNPEQTNLALFLVRWITHFCAPGFFFLAGVAIFIYLHRTADKRQLTRFLVTRGIWLIFLEVTIVGFAWSFNPGWSWLGVIWSLGWSFIGMAMLIYVPRPVLLWIGAAVALLHAVPGEAYFATLDGPPGTLIALLYSGGGAVAIPVLGSKIVLYSVLPWLAVMMIGFGLGDIFVKVPETRGRIIIRIGLIVTAAFVFLRLTNIYGNPLKIFPGGWSGSFEWGVNLSRTVVSFLNTSKYPPSPQFALMTLGPLLICLGYWARFDANGQVPRWLKPLDVFGRVPFFFYVFHLYLIHSLALGVALLSGKSTDSMFWGSGTQQVQPANAFGYGTMTVIVTWMLVVVLLYPLCLWFMNVKRSHKQWWLRYL